MTCNAIGGLRPEHAAVAALPIAEAHDHLHRTAIGYLLQKGEEGDAGTLATALTDLAQALPALLA